MKKFSFKLIFMYLRKMQKAYVPYMQALFDIFRYQLVSSIYLAVLLYAINWLMDLLIRSTGRVAVSSGDFLFIFTSWQGILLILFALLSFAIYNALDLYSKIVYASNLIKREKDSLFKSIHRGFVVTRRFLTPAGLMVILYITLIAPFVGLGLSVSLTDGLYIPTFIMSVIKSTPLYSVLYLLASVFFVILGVMNMFVLHGVIIDGMSVKASMKQSAVLIRNNLKDYIKQNLLFTFAVVLINIVILASFFFMPMCIVDLLHLEYMTERFFLIFCTVMTGLAVYVVNSFTTPFYIIKITQLYYSYKDRESAIVPVRQRKKHTVDAIAAVLAIIVMIAASAAMNFFFDDFFPAETDVQVIAHRAGGNEAPENTVKGIETAVAAGAYGAEIDIQRTADGYYVVNHDTTFERTAGDKRKPGDMTLAQIKDELSVSGEPVATLEEMLEACRGKITLFIELKGKSADQKMVDDTVKLIKEYDMIDECVIISLKYELIDYTESTYPEIQTGFLTFLSFGDTASLNCDFLGLEEESATVQAINNIHLQDKKVLVWTPNKKTEQKHFLLSDADAIITDNVYQADDLIDSLAERNDAERFFDTILSEIL